MALLASFSESNPNFGIFVRTRRYFMPGPVDVLHHYVGLFVIGCITWVGSWTMFAGLGSSILITGFGLAFVHGWMKFLVPDRYYGNLRGGLGFEQGIKMYKSIISIIHFQLARKCLTTCMHHFYLVICCSMGVWVLIKQIVDKEGFSVFLSVGSFAIVGVLFFFEWFVVNFISMAATGSKEFLYRLQKNNEKSKYRRKVLKALLPNSINLEMIGSVDTIRYGIQRNYFLNFGSRVADCTIRLLLAKSKSDVFFS